MKPSPAQAFGAQMRAQAADPRTPPHDDELERAVLGCVLLGGAEAFDAAREVLSAHDFYATPHQLLWGILDRLRTDGSVLDPVTIRDAVLRNGTTERVGGEAYLAELARTVPSPAGTADYASGVKRYSLARSVIGACRDLGELARDTTRLDELPGRVAEEFVALRETLAGVRAPGFDLDTIAPRLPDLLAEPDPEQSWVIHELLETAGGMLLYGPSYVGKSLTSWFSALCVARGYGLVLNRGVDAPPASAVIFFGESTRRQIKNAFRRFLRDEAFVPEALRLVDVHAVSPFPDLAKPEGREWYERVLVEAGAKYAVFDSATALVGADLNDGLVASSVMTFLSQLGKKHGIARCLVHHTRKASTHGERGSSADKAAGAAQWVRLADTAVLVESDGPGRVKIDPWKIRDHEQGKPYIARITDTLHFEFIAEVGPKRKEGDTAGPEPSVTPFQILEAIRDAGSLTARQLEELFEVSRHTVKRRTGSGEFVGWLQSGIVVRHDASGRTPETYHFVGPMP